jgi:predicted DsbA family dithiol-disulfide isomerase
MSLVNATPGTLTMYSDIACPWASLAVHRLHEAARRLGGPLVVDHRAFCLELVNRRPTPKRVLDAEVPVVGGRESGLGWRTWQGRDAEYPVTSLIAMEAVQAAKAPEVGGLAASTALDAALRSAFYAGNRCISMLPVVLEIAEDVPLVNTEALTQALEAGKGRPEVIAQTRAATASGSPVQGSPQVFTPDGRTWHNPGITVHWTGEKGRGFPVITEDDPSVYDEIIAGAASAAA